MESPGRRGTVSEIAWGIGLLVAGFVGAFVLSNYFYGGRGREKPSAAAPDVDVRVAPESGTHTEVAEVLKPATAEAPQIVFAPVPASAATATAPEDAVVRLRRAFETGRLSREAYEANLRKLGLAVSIERPMEEAPPIEVAPMPVSARAVPPSGGKADRLRSAFVSGRLSREAYEANLRKLGLEPEPPLAPAVTPAPSLNDAAKIERLTQAFAAGRIPKAAYQANLRKLGIEPEAEEVPTMLPKPKPVDPAQDKAAKLRAAFEAGRMSRELYERNLRSLGLEPEPARPPVAAALPPEYRLERLHAAYRSGRMSRDLYERNVRALGGEPMPAPEPAPRADERAAHVTKAFEQAFEESRLILKVQDENLAAVDAAIAPPVPADDRVARVREAFEAGRISREAYVRNLRVLGARGAVNPPPPAPEMEPVSQPASVPEAPVANPPSPVPSELPAGFQERIALITRAYAEGRVTQEIYERNLARMYEAVEPRLAQLRQAFEAGRISQPAYDANVRRVLQSRGVP